MTAIRVFCCFLRRNIVFIATIFRIVQSSMPEEMEHRLRDNFVDGTWSAWQSWTCSAVCGPGFYFRKRICFNSHGTSEFQMARCDGQAIHRSQRQCERICASLNWLPFHSHKPVLTDAEEELVIQNLKSFSVSLTREYEQGVMMDCGQELATKMLHNQKKSIIFWEHNGHPLLFNIHRMFMYNVGLLGIAGLKQEDNGVYTCHVKIGKLIRTLALFTLSVRSDTTNIPSTEGQNVIVNCSCEPIQRLLGSITVTWILNNTGKVLTNFTLGKKDRVYDNTIYNVHENFTGTWICFVKDFTLNRTWLTNTVNVYVGPNRLRLPVVIAMKNTVIGIYTFVPVMTVIVFTTWTMRRKWNLRSRRQLFNR